MGAVLNSIYGQVPSGAGILFVVEATGGSLDKGIAQREVGIDTERLKSESRSRRRATSCQPTAAGSKRKEDSIR